MASLTLITGGIKSGKSSFALDLARERCRGSKCFIATAEPLDDEMKIKIVRHRQERGDDFRTVEEPLHLAKALEAGQKTDGLILIDCLTLWMNNLLFRFENDPVQIKQEISGFAEALNRRTRDIMIVTNEIGLGVVPENSLARRFMDQLGILNRRAAVLADEVYFMVSGIPNRIKGATVGKLDS